MAFFEGQAGSGSASGHWLAREAADWFSKTLAREGSPDFAFALHDADEIGPKMLGRIAKHTGLKPTDL